MKIISFCEINLQAFDNLLESWSSIMKDFENNAHFWQKIDSIYLAGDFHMVSKKGEIPKGMEEECPCDYGYITSDHEVAIDCFKGTQGEDADAIIVLADILEKKIQVSLLVGCSQEEELAILRFLNRSSFQKSVLMRRASEVPNWDLEEE